MVPFPVPSGSYRDLAVVKDGVVWIEVADRGGELGATRAGVTGEAPSDVLWHYNLSARHLDKLCERVDTFFSVSGDGERLVVRHRDDIIVVPSSHKVDDDDPPASASI
ncbi:protease [Cutibacterium acnes JCM 18909]|nr:protease [Cutibacterium acnes JCM 18909]